MAALVLSRLACFYRIAVAGSLVACAASLALLAAAHTLGAPEWLYALCRAAERVCAAAVAVAWLGRISRLRTAWITPCCLATFLAAVLLGFCGMTFEGVGKQVLHALLLPLSMLVFCTSPDPREGAEGVRKGGAAPAGVGGFVVLVWRVLLVFFVFGVVDWVVTLCAGMHAETGAALGTFACSVVVLLALLGVSLAAGGVFSTSYVYKVVVPLVFAGLIAVVGLGPSSTVGIVLVQTSYTCFDVFCLVLTARAAARTGVRPEGALGVCRAVECSVPLAVLLMVHLWGIGSGAEGLARAIAAVRACALLLAALVDGRGIFESDAAAPTATLPKPEAALFAGQCEHAIRDFGLTRREGEVMSLIARGRSVPHIAGRLDISRSTVKTYVARIYEKLGVAERQEMLDVIESLPADA